MDILKYIRIQNYLATNGIVLERPTIDLIKAYCANLKNGKNEPLILNDEEAVLLLGVIATSEIPHIDNYFAADKNRTYDGICEIINTETIDKELIAEIKTKIKFENALRNLTNNSYQNPHNPSASERVSATLSGNTLATPTLFSLNRSQITALLDTYLQNKHSHNKRNNAHYNPEALELNEGHKLNKTAHEFVVKNYTQIIFDTLFQESKQKMFAYLDGLNIDPGILFEKESPNIKTGNLKAYTAKIKDALYAKGFDERLCEEIAEHYVQKEIKRQLKTNTSRIHADLNTRVFNKIKQHLTDDSNVFDDDFVAQLQGINTSEKIYIDKITNIYLKNFILEKYNALKKKNDTKDDVAIKDDLKKIFKAAGCNVIIEQLIGAKTQTDINASSSSASSSSSAATVTARTPRLSVADTPEKKYILPILRKNYAPLAREQSIEQKEKIRNDVRDEIASELHYLSIDRDDAQAIASKYTNRVIATQNKVQKSTLMAKAILEKFYAEYTRNHENFDKSALQDALDFLRNIDIPGGQKPAEEILAVYKKLDFLAYAMAHTHKFNLNDAFNHKLAKHINALIKDAHDKTRAALDYVIKQPNQEEFPHAYASAKALNESLTQNNNHADRIQLAEAEALLSEDNLDEKNDYYFSQRSALERMKFLNKQKSEAHTRKTKNEPQTEEDSLILAHDAQLTQDAAFTVDKGKNQAAFDDAKARAEAIKKADQANKAILDESAKQKQTKLSSRAWWAVRGWGFFVASQSTYMLMLTALDMGGVSLFSSTPFGLLWIPLLTTCCFIIPVWLGINFIIDRLPFEAKTKSNIKIGIFLLAALSLAALSFIPGAFFLLPAALFMAGLGSAYLVNRFLSQSNLEKGWIYLLATQDRKGIMRLWQGFVDENKFSKRELFWFKVSFSLNFCLALLYAGLAVKVLLTAVSFSFVMLTGGGWVALGGFAALLGAVVMGGTVFLGYITLTGGPLAGLVKTISHYMHMLTKNGLSGLWKGFKEVCSRTSYQIGQFFSNIYKEAREYRLKTADTGFKKWCKVFYKYTGTTLASLIVPVLLGGAIMGMSILLFKSAKGLISIFTDNKEIIANGAIPLATVGIATKGALVVGSSIRTGTTLATAATTGMSEKTTRTISTPSSISRLEKAIMWFSALILNPIQNFILNSWDLDKERMILDNKDGPKPLPIAAATGALMQSASFAQPVEATVEAKMKKEVDKEQAKFAKGTLTNYYNGRTTKESYKASIPMYDLKKPTARAH